MTEDKSYVEKETTVTASNQLNSQIETEKKKDKKHDLSFLAFGIGMLLPWNSLMAGMDFFV